jgi:hypothetical protein
MSNDPDQLLGKTSDDYIRLAYQSALEDIRFFKKQQWIVTNYTLLIYGAILAASRVIASSGNEWFAYILGIVGLLSLFLIGQLQCSTIRARDRKNAIRGRVSEDLRALLFGRSRGSCAEFFDQYGVMGLLAIVIIGGDLLSVWVLPGLGSP